VRAQTPLPAQQPPADRSKIIPPRLIAGGEVTYPPDAQGDALVVLILVVSKEGAVTEARASQGEEPFASAAIASAQKWKFEPAQRDGQSIAARIHFEVRFTHPEPPPQDNPSTPGPAAQPAPGSAQPSAPSAPGPQGSATQPRPPAPLPKAVEAAAPGPIDVTVYGVKPIAAVSMGRAEVRQLPGAFGDPFRAIEAMPGVTPIVSGLPFFYVRGAPPGNVGYFLDGVRVPYLYHVGLGPSVIHPGLVERVDLYPGGYPARYGRYAGGIVAADTTAPRTDFHGEGNIRLFDAGALVESGFGKDKGTVLLAGRYSYTALALSLIVKDVKLDYRDYEARVTYDLTPKDRISVFSFGSYDLIGATIAGVYRTVYGAEFYRADARWDHRFGPATTVRTAVTYGFDRTRMSGQPVNLNDNMVSGRLEATHEMSPNATWRGGADVTLDSYHSEPQLYVDPDDPTTKAINALFPARNDLAVGAWTDLPLRYAGVEFTPGVRVDAYRSGSASAVGVEPRVMSRIKVSDRVHVIHALGIAHQPPSFIIPMPGLAVGSLQGGLQRTVQASAGVEVDLPESTTATLTAFDNIFLNMSDTLGAAQRGGGDSALAEQRSLGSGKGIELYIKRRLTHRLGGFVAYTLSRSTRSVGTEHFPSAFDRTHVLNAALAYNLGRNWRAGTRLMLYSGAPVQPSSSGGLIAPSRDSTPERDPLFYRIDVRFEKRWNLTKTVWLSFVAEMLNATLHKEVLFGNEIGPVALPSLGVEGGF
jgi:TonB family protein